MNGHRLAASLLPLLLAAACGASVTEHRVVHLESLPATCSARLIETSVMDTTLLGRYEVVGSVVLSADEASDPFDPQLIEQVRIRACAMGSELFSLAQAGAVSTPASANTIQYTVLRNRSADPGARPTVTGSL